MSATSTATTMISEDDDDDKEGEEETTQCRNLPPTFLGDAEVTDGGKATTTKGTSSNKDSNKSNKGNTAQHHGFMLVHIKADFGARC